VKLKTLNIGIAGYGTVGRRRHKSIKKVKNFNVIAVCDRKFKKDPTAFFDETIAKKMNTLTAVKKWSYIIKKLTYPYK
jgi:glyceraldehyde-3-phosphate dehydrogenase/erythrose-4-phosphate dehydrogenase